MTTPHDKTRALELWASDRTLGQIAEELGVEPIDLSWLTSGPIGTLSRLAVYEEALRKISAYAGATHNQSDEAADAFVTLLSIEKIADAALDEFA